MPGCSFQTCRTCNNQHLPNSTISKFMEGKQCYSVLLSSLPWEQQDLAPLVMTIHIVFTETSSSDHSRKAPPKHTSNLVSLCKVCFRWLYKSGTVLTGHLVYLLLGDCITSCCMRCKWIHAPLHCIWAWWRTCREGCSLCLLWHPSPLSTQPFIPEKEGKCPFFFLIK